VDILSTLKLLSERGVTVHVVKTGQQLDGSLTSKILTTVLGLAAEIERELMRQRTMEGQARAKAAGKHIGRPRLTDDSQRRSKLDAHAEDIKKLATRGVTKLNLARVFDCDWITMNRWLQRHDVRVHKGGPQA
jgi:DNA invertase Pin-like site-specific DNA recombinase